MLKAAGIAEIVAAVLAADDLSEDAAAEKIAASMAHRNIEAKPAATGRVNLHAKAAGVFTVDATMIDAINAVDPTITIATLAQHAPVEKGQMVATVKIIPFAVASALVDAVTKICAGGEIFAVNAYQPVRVGVIQTVLPGIKPSVLDKTLRVTEARLARSGARLTAERRTPHEIAPVAEAAASLARDNDMVVIFGASAMSDFGDVVPAAIEKAGGTVIRAGMPVDPGNLLVLGTLDGKRVIGAPGCARSPKENGFDWVLDRLIAGLDVTAKDIAGMGVGGLLMEIPTRPQPREPLPAKSRARRSTSCFWPPAAPAAWAGRTSCWRCSTASRWCAAPPNARSARKPPARSSSPAISASGCATALVGPRRDLRRQSGFRRRPVLLAESRHRAGRSRDAAGAHDRSRRHAGHLVGRSRPADRGLPQGRAAIRWCAPRMTGKRGNPVLLPRSLFPAIAHLEGDTGARHLVEAEGLDVIDVEIGEGASIDVDTREALEGAGGVLQD